VGITFRTYVEMDSGSAAQGSMPARFPIQSGIAIANNSSTPATVNFELTTLSGAVSGVAGPIAVPAQGHVSKFVRELFPTLDLPFQGILRVSSSNSISIVSLRMRYNERGDFLVTTTPASNEASASSTAELIFPHIVDRGGYTTQFILFSGITNQSTSGTLRFFAQDGRALNVTVR